MSAISPRFAENLIKAFDDHTQMPVHLLFNLFWRDASPEVVEAYVKPFEEDERLRAFVAEGFYAEPLTVERLAASPAGSLGRAAHAFITENGLEEKLATNYRQFHDALEQNGMLDGMPDGLRYAVLRGFQLHDFLHVLTGYAPDPRGEIALQAFCLAQVRFPYFAMWMSVTTTRAAVVDPTHTVGLMDAITDGWRFGRSVRNIQFERWEERLDEPLDELRLEYGIAPEGRAPLEPAAVV